MIKFIATIILFTLSTFAIAQDDEAVIREFTPKRSELENTFDRTFYWNRFVSIHGFLKFKKDKFRFTVYQSTHVPHGKPSKSKINTIRGSFTIQENVIRLDLALSKADTAKVRDRPDSLYLIRGVELSTKTDLERDRSYKVIFLIPANKEQEGAKMIEDFMNEMTKATTDLREFDYWDLYLRAGRQLREASLSADSVTAFTRQYFNEP